MTHPCTAGQWTLGAPLHCYPSPDSTTAVLCLLWKRSGFTDPQSTVGIQHRLHHQKGSAEDILPAPAQEVQPASAATCWSSSTMQRSSLFSARPSLPGLGLLSNRTGTEYNGRSGLPKKKKNLRKQHCSSGGRGKSFWDPASRRGPWRPAIIMFILI